MWARRRHRGAQRPRLSPGYTEVVVSDFFAYVGGIIAEGGLAAVIGICALGCGLCLYGIYRVTDPNDGYAPTRRRPKEPNEWDIEPDPSTLPYKAKHDGDQTRRLFPPGPRRDDAGQPLEVNYAGTPGRLREAQEEDGQEEGRSYRERWQDRHRAIEDGEEGGEDAEAPRTIDGWYYSPPMDAYYLLDSAGEIIRTVSAIEWEDERGKTAKDLLIQGFPMIPEHVPYHGREAS
jgi:hypothetical protein